MSMLDAEIDKVQKLAADEGYAIPWDLIAELVIPLIADCFNSKDSIDALERDGLSRLQKAALKIRSRRATGNRKSGRALAFACEQTLENASAEMVKTCCEECCDLLDCDHNH